MKKQIAGALVICLLLCGCETKQSDSSQTQPNTHAELAERVRDAKIDFTLPEENSTAFTNTGEPLLSPYLQAVTSWEYTYEIVLSGLGENDQLIYNYRTQIGANYLEEQLVNAVDDDPDSVTTYVSLGGVAYVCTDDGIHPPAVQSGENARRKTDSSLFPMFSGDANYAYAQSRSVRVDGKEYICETWKTSDDTTYAYYFLDGELAGMKYTASSGIPMNIYLLSFSEQAEKDKIKVPSAT